MSAASRKGASFEQAVASWLATRLGDDRIERRAKNGRNDRGDLTGLRTPLGGRVVWASPSRLELTGAHRSRTSSHR